MRTKKDYKGPEIISEYSSANIKKAVYNINEKNLKITFASNAVYSYEGVPHEIFSAFDNSESQGVYFNKNIAKNFTYKKI